ncbi:reverse transcriptase [Gossypium australe]|uniref:Reverse transcriptase n=1 Tax=Gossypium australe TaxID=47621 RepID=A0A5B6VA76_9ROSI|nr:reverse transcriptase [Gossypium australe]
MFLDAFLEEFLGLPPDRELKDLKIQLQDVLDCGFIHPIISPWGALVLLVKKKYGLLAQLKVKPVLLEQMNEVQFINAMLVEKIKLAQQGDIESFNIDMNDCLWFCNWIYVLKNAELKRMILCEAHNGPFAMHPGSAKIIVWSLSKLAEVYIHEIVRLHGVLVFIIKIPDSPKDFGSKKVLKVVEDMLRAYVIDLESGRERYLPLPEFVYNKNVQSSIYMASGEALYG